MKYYLLDTSVAVRIMYGQSPAAARWFDRETGNEGSAVLASRLLKTELTRVLRRDELPVQRRDALLDYLHVIPFTEAVFAEAEAILPHIKTLDAIHLASLVHSGLDAVVVTHDATMRSMAQRIGYETFDPVVDV